MTVAFMACVPAQVRPDSILISTLFFSVKMQLYVGTDSIPETETVNECVSCLASRIWVHMVSGGFERRVVTWEESCLGGAAECSRTFLFSLATTASTVISVKLSVCFREC